MQGFYEIFVIYYNWAGWVHILSPARYPIVIKNGVYIYIKYIHACLSCLHVQSIPIAHRSTCNYYSMCMDFVK